MKVIYRSHLKRRLKERKIPDNYPKRIYLESKKKFFDMATNHQIAILELTYSGKLKNLAISYDIIGQQVEIITIHPISTKEIDNKIESGRWTKE